MAERKTRLQSNVSLLETFKMGRKAPVVANRVFNTLADAQLYVDDWHDSATEGVRITVLNDSMPEKNGVYFVKQVGDNNGVPGILVKICRSTCAWFKGNQVNVTHTTTNVWNSEPGDAYLNSETLDIFVLGPDMVWVRIGNLTPQQVDRNRCYYIITEDSATQPQFSTSTWFTTIPAAENDAKSRGLLETGQAFLWTRLYDDIDDPNYNLHIKYTCSMIYSSLNLGTFQIGTV